MMPRSSGGETESHTFFSGRSRRFYVNMYLSRQCKIPIQKVSDIEMCTFNVVRSQILVLSKN